MIPKIIHYIWLGREPLPPELEKCVESWRKFMPDWEIRKWDEDSIKDIEAPWLLETIEAKKYAFASDYIRMHALHNYGGLYLDTDVMALKSFEPLLTNRAFIGRESCIHIKGYLIPCVDLTSYCFGAEKGNPYIKRCLEYYKDRRFVLSEDKSLPMEFRFSILNLSYIMCEIAKTFGYKDTLASPEFQDLPELTVYPPDYFNPLKESASSYCRHLSIGSWRENKTQTEFKYTIGYKISWRVVRLFKIILRRFNYLMIKIK